MFDIFFGWRKASKCKKLVKRVRCRLKLLKNKRSSIARLVRDDMAQLILAGHEETALNRAQQLCNDMSLLSAYELLDQFCEFILVHLSYIRRHKDIPDDINEAVSSLIFASARFGDLPELRGIRKLFAERYGQRFATAAVELFPGNHVNHQIIEKLSVKPIPADAKQNLFDEIARDCSLDTDVLAFEFASEMQKQEKEDSKNQILDMYLLTYYNETEGCQIQDSGANSDMTITSVSSSIARQSSHDKSESPIYNEEEEVENGAQSHPPYVVKVADQVAKPSQETVLTYAINSASSSESLDQCPEENLIYLDDIEEFESPKAKDQRLFMFKSSRKQSHKNNNENVDSARTGKSKKGSEERVISGGNQSMDMECLILQEDLCDEFSEAKAQKLRTGHDHQHGHVAAVYDVFAYPRKTSYGTRKEMAAPPCRRAATMPQERHKESLGGNIRRFNSSPYKHPSHVHPKLPDYDDIAAKFMALKENQHQNKVILKQD